MSAGLGKGSVTFMCASKLRHHWPSARNSEMASGNTCNAQSVLRRSRRCTATASRLQLWKDEAMACHLHSVRALFRAGVTCYWTANTNDDVPMLTWSNLERLCVDLQPLERHMGGRGGGRGQCENSRQCHNVPLHHRIWTRGRAMHGIPGAAPGSHTFLQSGHISVPAVPIELHLQQRSSTAKIRQGRFALYFWKWHVPLICRAQSHDVRSLASMIRDRWC